MAGINNVAAVLTLFTLLAAAAGPLLSRAAEDCSNDITVLALQCYASVQRDGPEVPPSAPCCDAIMVADLPCVCAHITPEMERMISVKKAVDVCQKCGSPLEHGLKCGSYVVPKVW